MNTRNIVTSRIAKITVGALALMSGALAIGTPASAATAVTFCSPAGSRPVQLVEVDASNRTISLVRNGRSGADGCGTFFNTPSNKRLAVEFDMKFGTAVYHAHSALYATPGTGRVDIGNRYHWTLICNQCSLD